MQDAYLIHSAGLVCFCYASQNQIVALVVLLLTAFCTFGLAAVSLWFVADLWVYSRHQGAEWLADVLAAIWWRSGRVSGLRRVARAVTIIRRMLFVALRSIRSALLACCDHSSDGTTDVESLPTTSPSRFRSVAWRIAKTNTRPPAAEMGRLLKEKARQATTLVSGRKNTEKHGDTGTAKSRSEEHTSELQSQ